MRLPQRLHVRRLLSITLAAAVSNLVAVPLTRAQSARTASDFAAQGFAKTLCSALYVSGRQLAEALQSAPHFVPEADLALLQSGTADPTEASIASDESQKTVRVTLHGFTGRARAHGDQGCVILPAGVERVLFEPVEPTTTLPDPLGQSWPTGDAPTGQPFPSELNRAKVYEAIDSAFADRTPTTAFLLVYKGQIIGERYGQGVNKDTQLDSGAMGAAVTAALLGVLAQQGRIALDQPAPVSLWQVYPGDPRAAITTGDLLRMKGRLLFTTASRPPWEWGREVPDDVYAQAGGIDAAHFVITRPIAPQPDPNGAGSADPLALGWVIRRLVEEAGEPYLTWPQRMLFDRIGIRRQVMEPDLYGNFLPNHTHGTARNWARLGLLYGKDGMWGDERILPEGWTALLQAPPGAEDSGQTGGLFRMNTGSRWDLPQDAYYLAGSSGQFLIIVPSLDLVVVRMGHRRGEDEGATTLNAALRLVLEALRARQPVSAAP